MGTINLNLPNSLIQEAKEQAEKKAITLERHIIVLIEEDQGIFSRLKCHDCGRRIWRNPGRGANPKYCRLCWP